jgi:predicted RND superfamily exporter protein
MHLAAQQASERAQRLAALIVRRPWSILAVALIVGVAALWLALGLRVDQQLRALLPDDAISTTRIDAMSERLGNQSDLYVEIRSPLPRGQPPLRRALRRRAAPARRPPPRPTST